jgi:hypothetical protein
MGRRKAARVIVRKVNEKPAKSEVVKTQQETTSQKATLRYDPRKGFYCSVCNASLRKTFYAEARVALRQHVCQQRFDIESKIGATPTHLVLLPHMKSIQFLHSQVGQNLNIVLSVCPKCHKPVGASANAAVLRISEQVHRCDESIRRKSLCC